MRKKKALLNCTLIQNFSCITVRYRYFFNHKLREQRSAGLPFSQCRESGGLQLGKN